MAWYWPFKKRRNNNRFSNLPDSIKNESAIWSAVGRQYFHSSSLWRCSFSLVYGVFHLPWSPSWLLSEDKTWRADNKYVILVRVEYDFDMDKSIKGMERIYRSYKVFPLWHYGSGHYYAFVTTMPFNKIIRLLESMKVKIHTATDSLKKL